MFPVALMEKKGRGMTAGVLCVHGAEQGETLWYSPAHAHSQLIPLLSTHTLTYISTKSGVLSGAVTLLVSLEPIVTQ